MRLKYITTLSITTILMCTALGAATVSVVNQSSQSTSTPSNNSPSLTSPASTQSTQGTKGTSSSGPATGKLPASKGGGASGGGGSRKSRISDTELALHPEEPTYTFPGLLAKIGRRWIGNDYLYNLHRNIGVVVEVVMQEGKPVSIDKEAIKAIVADTFLLGELVPESFATEATPPLPFFHILIFAFPSENNNIAFITGRLFEDALLARYGLDPIGTWQAISWEKQDLVVTSPLQFDEQVKKSVANIAKTFVDKVQLYAKIKEESESDAKIYFPKVIQAPSRSAAPAQVVTPSYTPPAATTSSPRSLHLNQP